MSGAKGSNLTAAADGPPLTTIRDTLVNVHLLPVDSRADRLRCDSDKVFRARDAMLQRGVLPD